MPADTPMVLVPREPTEAMIEAGWEAKRAAIVVADPADIYHAMLSASPAREGDLGSSASPIPTEGHGAAVLADLLAWVDEMTAKHGNPNGTDYEQGVNDHGFRIRGKIAALSAPSPREGGAPVAWGLMHPNRDLLPLTYRTRERAQRHADRYAAPHDLNPVALYTRPTPATPEGLLSDASIDVTARTLEALADELSETLGARAQEGGGGGSEAERELLRAFTRVLAALQPQAQPAALSPETDR